ncbi:MAG TPA: tetratricopeptide repeat protein [Telluria sp.]
MKNAFVIVTLSGVLTACAVAPQQQPAVAAAPAAAAAQATAAPAPAEEKLPHVEMTPTMLYQLSKAEFEFKAGNWQGPYLTMLSLAQQTRDPRLARRAAEMAVTAKQADDALAAIKLWRELAPESEEATQYYVGLVVMSDDIAPAEPIFEQRLRNTPQEARGLVLFQIQQLLMRAPDKAAGAAMLDRLVAPYRNTVEGRVVMAQAALARGNKVDAIREAEAALAQKPDSEVAVLTLAQAIEDDEKIAPLLAKFLVANPNAREVRIAHARVLVNLKQFEQARSEFQLLLKANPDDAGVLYALGVLAVQLRDSPAAEQYFTRFVELVEKEPDDERDPSKAYQVLSQLAEERGDTKAALAWLDKVKVADPKAEFGLQLRRAQLTGKSGDLAGAQRMLAALKPVEPSAQAQVVLVQAQVLRDAGQVAQAYAVLEQGAKRFPSNPDLLYDFALMAEKAGHVDVMEKALREVMVQAPDNHHAYNALGYSLAERNVRLQEAYQLIDKALKMAPGDPFIMDSMGWVQYRMGNLNEAEAQLRKAYALRNDPEIAVHLGEVLWQKGMQDDARQLWRAARAKDPDNEALRSTLARLKLSL